MKSFPMMNMILLDKRVLSNHYNYVQCTSALHFTVNSNLSSDFNHKAMAWYDSLSWSMAQHYAPVSKAESCPLYLIMDIIVYLLFTTDLKT